MNVYKKYYMKNKDNFDNIYGVIRQTKDIINNSIKNLNVNSDEEVYYKLPLNSEVINVKDNNDNTIDYLYSIQNEGYSEYFSKNLIKDFFNGALDVSTQKYDNSYVLNISGSLEGLTDLKNNLEEEMYINSNKEKYSVQETEIVHYSSDSDFEYLIFSFPFMVNGNMYFYKYDKRTNYYYMFDTPKNDFANRNTYHINQDFIIELFSYARANNYTKTLKKNGR